MSKPGLSSLSVLYVEDDGDMREQVVHFLQKKCRNVLTAGNGREALECFSRHHPDIVISDIMMPEMDGLELAGAIKQCDPSTPIILATAFNDPTYLQKAIDIGVDNYVLKPIDLEKLHAAMLKSADLLLKTRALEDSRTQLEAYRQAAEEERALVSELMRRMMQPELMVDRHVKFMLEPADLVSGDLLTLRRTRNDRLYIMLADSTGHGLPAALNLLPINNIFHTMARKGMPVSQIVEEMNRTVRAQSPANRFVAAFIACIDNHNRIIESWNGGFPPALLVDHAGEAYHCLPSLNLPLGVMDADHIAHTEIIQWSCPSQLIACSDGVIEAENGNGTAWGMETVKQVIKEADAAQRFEALSSRLHEHLGGRRASDDVTLAVIDCGMDNINFDSLHDRESMQARQQGMLLH